MAEALQFYPISPLGLSKCQSEQHPLVHLHIKLVFCRIGVGGVYECICVWEVRASLYVSLALERQSKTKKV